MNTVQFDFWVRKSTKITARKLGQGGLLGGVYSTVVLPDPWLQLPAVSCALEADDFPSDESSEAE